MRYDLRILWVDDTPAFFDETKEILEMFAEDNGISLRFDYIENVNEFFKRMKNDIKGFKLYDIFFVDFTLSDDIVGSNLIRDLRREKMDSDILFYSSEHESDIRKTVVEDLGSFEGVYIANRENFEEKSNYLINKNARRLTTLSNIRGFLMDQTSENDYTIKSYILRKFDMLSQAQKQEISEMLLESIKDKEQKFLTHANTEIAKLENSGIKNIKQTMGLMNELFPIELKYRVFQKMIEFLGEQAFNEVSVQQYMDEIIKARNTLAHKKLDVCRTQEYILYYDTIKQFEDRQCPLSCDEHSDDNKYSLKQWDIIRKNVQKFGKSIDTIQGRL
ncbi:MAG: hypothetical protein NC489_33095 [Ruminococcus flavefaciens]|nr:hypothetical protein [Ruminococcus flavefaciens]